MRAVTRSVGWCALVFGGWSASAVGADLTRLEMGEAPEGDRPVDLEVTADGTTALILHFGSGNVTFFDLASGVITGALDVGAEPHDLELTPDGVYALTADSASATVSVIRLADRTLAARIAVDADPVQVLVSADSTTAWVAHHENQSLTRIDLPTLGVAATGSDVGVSIAHHEYGTWGPGIVGYPIFARMQLALGETVLLVPDTDGEALRVFDSWTLEELGSVPAPGIRSVAVHPNTTLAAVRYGTDSAFEGRHAFVDLTSLELFSIDSFEQTISESTAHVFDPLGKLAWFSAQNKLGLAAAGSEVELVSLQVIEDIAFDDAGTKLVVCGPNVQVIDPRTMEVLKSMDTGVTSKRLALSPVKAEGVVLRPYDERVMHFTTRGEHSEMLHNTPTGMGLEGDGPGALAVSRDGRLALVCNRVSRNLAVIDVRASSVVTHLPLVDQPIGAAISPDGDLALVFERAGAQYRVSVLDLGSLDFVLEVMLDSYPLEAHFSPDGRLALLVTSQGFPGSSDAIYFLPLDDLGSGTYDRVSVGSIPPSQSLFDLEFTADGLWAVLTANWSGKAYVLDIEKRDVAAALDVPFNPAGVAIRPDGKQAVVAGHDALQFFVLDGAQTRPSHTLPMSTVGERLIYSNDGTRLFAAGAFSLSAIDSTTLERRELLAATMGALAKSEHDDTLTLSVYTEDYGSETLMRVRPGASTLEVLEQVDLGQPLHSLEVAAEEGTAVITLPDTDEVGILPRFGSGD